MYTVLHSRTKPEYATRVLTKETLATQRRHMALQVKPNSGHHALAALARAKPNFLCLTQNVDNLSPRAGHPSSQLRTLHGSLFTLKCSSAPSSSSSSSPGSCTYVEPNNTLDPLCPALAPASVDPLDPSQPGKIPLLDPSHPLPTIAPSQLPQCPRCKESGKQSLLRPGVVWFGESLDAQMLKEVDDWIDQGPIDIVLVLGTSSVVYPAAGYAERARTKGVTSVVTVNKEVEKRMWRRPEDLAFQGGAEEWLGRMFEPLTGVLGEDGGGAAAGIEEGGGKGGE